MNIILFDEGQRFFSAADERCRHIGSVLHMSVGDSFLAGEYNGWRGRATITSADGEGIAFDFAPERFDGALHPLTVILASVRPICMKRILRELVSLGVGRLIVSGSDLGEKSYRSATLYTSGEYLEIMKSGAMQSGHTGLSDVVFTDDMASAIREAGREGEHLVLDVVPGAQSLSRMDLAGKELTLAIGGERGWSAGERALFQKEGYTPASLGGRILRTETAAVSAVSLALAGQGLI